MNYALLITLSILPAIILLWYFERQDRGRKEPSKLKWKIFGWGILATIFAAIIELNLESLYPYLGITPQGAFWIYIGLSAFVTAALVEESLKLWIVKTHIYKNKNFDEVMDGITYTIIASLGFATMENVLYVVEGGYAIGVLRALISVPAHALFSGIMGYYIGVSRFVTNDVLQKKLIRRGLGLAILYHGLFNFFLFSQTWLFVLVIPLMVIMGIQLKSKIRKAHLKDHVDVEPLKKITAGRVVKILISAILIFVGVGSFIGSIMLVKDNTEGYTIKNIFISAGFCLVLLIISYLLIKKKKEETK